MPLSEDEELELLELENEAALAEQKEQTSASSKSPFSLESSLPEAAGLAATGAMLSRFGGPAAAAGAGLAGGYSELGRMAQEAVSGSPNVPKTIPESLGRFAQGVYRGAGGELMGQGILKGAGAVSQGMSKAGPALRKVGSQIIRTATGVPEREAAAVLADPELLSRAMSVKQAGAQYQKALDAGTTVGLKSGGEGTRAAFGKSVLSPESTINSFDELYPQIQNGTLDLQSALALRQNASHNLGATRNDWYTEGLRNVLNKADEYIESKLVDFPEAVKAFREAKIAEEFSSWLPLNKNLSPNVLRTAGALAVAAKGASEGRILPMLAVPAVSPRVWGMGIRAGAAAAPVVGKSAGYGARVGSQIATDGLRRKYMERR